MMRKFVLFVALMSSFIISTPVWAHARALPLNLVKYPLQVEGWAKTDTANVTIDINASLKENALADLHQQMLKNLERISTNGEWHITSFNQSKSQAGLETVSAQAQARLPSTALSGLRQKAKSVSQPGETYEVGRIDFTPSLQDIQDLRAKLRDQIFQLVKVELARLNKIYPDVTFFVHSINFMPPKVEGAPMPRAQVMMAAGAPLQVSDKVIVSARVQLASRINLAGQKR